MTTAVTRTATTSSSGTDLADHAHLEALLRCWVREGALSLGEDRLEAVVPGTGVRLVAEVLHRSPTGLHRFGEVVLVRRDGTTCRPTAADLARLLSAGSSVGEGAELQRRVAESVHNLSLFTQRPAEADLAAPLFLPGERALLLGHRHHPAPKSRGGLTGEQLRACSPELDGRFQVHWFEVDEDLVRHDHRESPCLRGNDTVELLADLAGRSAPPGSVLVPAHPWQAAAVLHRPAVASLVASRRLRPLGPSGQPWWATSSLRTLYRTDQPVMLKLSLGLPITNSVREATPTELRRGLEVHDLLRAGHMAPPDPDFRVVRDPAWLAVTDPADATGQTLTGLDVTVREVPDDVDRLVCLAGLASPTAPTADGDWGPSLLSQAAAEPASWFAEYVDHVLLPMVEVYAATGVGLEAHQQNTLVRLDGSGRVTGGAYRDNQGYYLAASRLPEAERLTGRRGSTLAVTDDGVVEDRLGYYLLHNQVLSLIGAMGAEGLADEHELLAVLRSRLREALPRLAAAGPAGPRLVKRWLTASTLPCKANLATRLHGIDEVTAPLDAQSVYLDVPNPLVVAP